MLVDLLLKNVNVYNAYVKRFIAADAAVLAGRFFYIGRRESAKLEPRQAVDAAGAYMLPGLIDIHMHIESSMAAPLPFSLELVKNGVTTIVAEPHEIANVFGLEGIRALLAAAEGCPVDIFLGVPSSVPSTSSATETSGAAIELADLAELLREPRVACLGEVMNYVDVINRPEAKINQLIRYSKAYNRYLPIEGHCPRLAGLDLARFLYAGIDSDHTQQSVAGLKERLLNGMFVEIQEKSLTAEIIACLLDNKMSEHFAFVTDDVMADALVANGHLNHLLKKAMALGMPPEDAIYAATFTPARRMAALTDRGSIAPGKLADFVLVDSPAALSVLATYKAGKQVFAAAGRPAEAMAGGRFPPHFYRSVHIPPLSLDAFRLPAAGTTVRCRVISVSDGTTFTAETAAELAVRNGEADWENSPYCFVGVFERHGKNGNSGRGLAGGDVIAAGAVATTYAHDHHNLLVIGRNKRDLLLAANAVIASQGGYCVVHDGKILAMAPLPVAGILSEAPLQELAAQVGAVKQAMRQLGYRHGNPVMSLSTLSLPVSQALKITDKGLINVDEQRIVPLFVE